MQSGSSSWSCEKHEALFGKCQKKPLQAFMKKESPAIPAGLISYGLIP